jgi:acyl-CoA oxidase
METHKTLPGIEVGDAGTKIALIVNDNGYLKLNNIRRSKDSLLCRYVNIEDDGTFIRNNNNASKLEYGGMLNLRLGIVYTCQYYLGKQATIATRYAFRRRQFEGKNGSLEPEVEIMSY